MTAISSWAHAWYPLPTPWTIVFMTAHGEPRRAAWVVAAVSWDVLDCEQGEHFWLQGVPSRGLGTYSHPSVSTRDWFQEPHWGNAWVSMDSQVSYIKWHCTVNSVGPLYPWMQIPWIRRNRGPGVFTGRLPKNLVCKCSVSSALPLGFWT